MMSSAFIAWFCSRCRKTSKLIFFFASMWTIPDLVQEIESIGRMLQVRLKAFTAGSKKAEEFEKGMLHTLCSKINGLNVLSIMDAQQLYQAISSSGSKVLSVNVLMLSSLRKKKPMHPVIHCHHNLWNIWQLISPMLSGQH